MALVLTRREGEGIWIGNAYVRIASIGKSSVKVAIKAPENVKVLRDELTRHDEPNELRDEPPGD